MQIVQEDINVSGVVSTNSPISGDKALLNKLNEDSNEEIEMNSGVGVQ